MATKKFTDEEARLRKNERQREYAKRTHYESSTKYEKTNVKRVVLKFVISTEKEILDYLDSKENKTGYIKSLIKKDMEASKKIE